METAAAPRGGLQVCPGCQSSMPHGSTICVQCGFDTRKGAAITTLHAVDKVRSGKGHCPECGYSLKGLKENRCPECGTIVTRQTEREKARYESARIARMAYIKPLIQFAIGAIGIGFILISQQETELFMNYLLLYGIRVPIGVAVFFACCLVWMGFDAPMHLTAIRLAGVYALVDLLAVLLVTFLPIPLFINVIVLFVYVGLLADSLDLDLQDAIIVGLITYLVRILATVAIRMYLINQ